ncbi:MAG: beta-ketoacyl-ACP synthase II [Thermomonas sp.]|uniref:beta-ketoacyl-ACP synthase II n=1 Tax=Thermomonas sp. TaxID=1971895 RepID=UPI001DCD8F1E|nr:beta-ketoacyl-ACP synthase II [Thermomonas sp.]MBZ0086938.1 beta-ketoacyl-ACP synthase II [Thermomonas sp.]
MNGRRVVVTGMGIISPLGNDLASNWEAVCNGRSGIGMVEGFDASSYPTRIAGEIRDFDITRWVNPKDAKKMDHFLHYGIAASLMAKDDAGLEVTEANAERIGALIGAGIGGIWGIEETTLKLRDGGVRKISPFYIPSTIINMVPGQLSLLTGIKGPTFSAVSACATANHSIGMAMRMIQYGDADVMFAGGAERGSSPTAMGGFCAMKAMSTRNDDPTRASRPWDADRDGFVLGDGAGVLVLEEYEHARARGARIHCELAGFGASSDAFHMTAPSENGDGPARCMAMALRDAGMNPEDIGYLNAHGTSTPLGDLAETHAIRRAFGAHADRLMVSSTKSMTGHLLGAAGGVEAIYAIQALAEGVIPPTINLDTPGEGCDLDYVPNTAREAKIEVAMSNGFGFGGTNGTLVFKRV